jgi:hypothetical protein
MLLIDDLDALVSQCERDHDDVALALLYRPLRTIHCTLQRLRAGIAFYPLGRSRFALPPTQNQDFASPKEEAVEDPIHNKTPSNHNNLNNAGTLQ